VGSAPQPIQWYGFTNRERHMDHETIQAIVTEVAKQLPSYSWTTLVIQVVLTGAVAAVAAYWGAYFKKTGEHLATKAHFEEILRQLGERTNLVETIKAGVAKSQLEANTKLVETIKAEVALSQVEASTKIVEKVRSELAQRDWAVREWANLRRAKIEELMGKVNACREYLVEHVNAAYHGQELPKGDPIDDLESIARLYFPELKDEAEAFLKMHRHLVFEGRKLYFALARGEEAKELKSAFAANAAITKQKESPRVSEKLTEAARELLEKIMGIRPQSEVAVPQNDVGTLGTKSP
jgi:hypothetical protein